MLEILPGSKPNWREICVSELEVWGALGTMKKIQAKPSVRIGSLDAPSTLTREQCIKALFPTARGNRIGPDKTDHVITDVTAFPLREDIVICRIDHATKGSSSTASELGAVKRGAKPALIGQTLGETLTSTERPSEGASEWGSLELERLQLTTAETGLLVHVAEQPSGPMHESTSTTSKLYRVTATGLVELLNYKSRTSHGEENNGDTCSLRDITLTKAMPPRLVLKRAAAAMG